MIQEKELRIGNMYITVKNAEMVVKGFDTMNKFVVVDSRTNDNDITAKNENSVIFEDLNAIELSEIHFTRLGFNTENKLFLNITSDKGARFEWIEEKKCIILSDGNNEITANPIRHLHQLQNIYYFLTGKDLVISS